MFSEEKFIDLDDSLKMYMQIREGGHKKWLIALHGLGEHLGRHKYLPDLFANKYNIAQFDLRGHGKSQGKRGAIGNFGQFSLDLLVVLKFLKENLNMNEYVLFGHSMGALISADFIQNYCPKELYPDKLFLSVPPVGLPGPLGKFFHLLPLQLTEKLKSIKGGFNLGGQVDISKLSHNKDVYKKFVSDPLTILKPHTSLMLNLIHATKSVFSRPLRVKCPLYCAVATEDALVDADSAIYYFQQIEKSCILKTFPGAYHEIHGELKKWREPYLEFLQESLS